MKIGGVQSQISENNKSVNRPLVSVVIPVYNVEKYLRECVDSVINHGSKPADAVMSLMLRDKKDEIGFENAYVL